MPVKNTAKYLTQCLDSIVAQEFQNWELIAVNDHSSDKSDEFLYAYAEKDKRIKVYQNQGEGIISALKLAYKKSSGEYITRMDSDDICKENKLKVLLNKLSQKGKGHLAIGKVQYFAENELGDGYKKYSQWLNSLTAEGNNFDEIYKECVIPSPCWMVHRSDFEKCGAFESNIYPEDYDLCFRMLKYGLMPIPCKEVLHLWRDHPDRSSRTDENYADNHFSELKVKYFLEIHRDKNKEIVIWGAGKKGKKIAQLLNQHKTTFHWVCNNDKKIGKDIFEVKVKPESHINKLGQIQVIICVANTEEQKEIRQKLLSLELKNMKDYFFFS